MSLRLVASLCLALSAAPKPKYDYADIHLHLLDFLQKTDGIEAVLAAMDRAGVKDAMISGMPLVKKWNAAEPLQPKYYLDDDSEVYWYALTDELVAREIEKVPADRRKRLHPFVSGFNPTDKNGVDHVKRMLALHPDLWEGIGEVFGRHDDLTALTPGEKSRADHPALEPIFELAAKQDLPMLVHSNIGSVGAHDAIYLHEMEGALKKHPDTRVVWAHAGISRRIEVPGLVDKLRGLLEKHKNLWIDVSWVVFEQEIAPGGKPSAAWIKLIEDHPKRFILGSDKVGRFSDYEKEIVKYDALLDRLAPETARRVARDNFLDVLPKRVRAGRST